MTVQAGTQRYYGYTCVTGWRGGESARYKSRQLHGLCRRVFTRSSLKGNMHGSAVQRTAPLRHCPQEQQQMECSIYQNARTPITCRHTISLL